MHSACVTTLQHGAVGTAIYLASLMVSSSDSLAFSSILSAHPLLGAATYSSSPGQAQRPVLSIANQDGDCSSHSGDCPSRSGRSAFLLYGLLHSTAVRTLCPHAQIFGRPSVCPQRARSDRDAPVFGDKERDRQSVCSFMLCSMQGSPVTADNGCCCLHTSLQPQPLAEVTTFLPS